MPGRITSGGPNFRLSEDARVARHGGGFRAPAIEIRPGKLLHGLVLSPILANTDAVVREYIKRDAPCRAACSM